MPFAGLLTVACLLLTTGCTGDDLPKKAESAAAAAPTAPVLAYVESNVLMVADRSGQTRRLTTMQDVPVQLLWSPDGSRIVWLNEGKDSNSRSDRLSLVDVASGATTVQPCPCSGLGFLGNDVATLSADGAAMLLFPSTGDPVRVPLQPSSTTGAWLAAGGRDHVMIAQPLDEGVAEVRATSAWLTADRSGKVATIAGPKDRISAHEALASPAGDRIAWLDLPSSGACWHSQRIVDIGYDGGRPVDPKEPDDPPMRAAHLPYQRTVLSYSWAGRGVVQTFAPVAGCQPFYPTRLVSYYREGDRWTFLGTGLLAIAFGGEGRRVRLVPTDNLKAVQEDGRSGVSGRLVFRSSNGTELTLTESARYAMFAPAEAAMATVGVHPATTSSSAAPGASTTDMRGRPLNSMLSALVSKVWQAAAANDTEALTSLCRKCDVGTLAWLREQETPAQILLLLRTHPEASEWSLVYPSLAARRCVDSPDHDYTCTAEQIADIALLNLKEDVNLDDPGNVYKVPAHSALLFQLDTNGAPVWAGRYSAESGK
ncbi:hypothetical protein GCM10010199_11830 [Dactylosporangium roseum]